MDVQLRENERIDDLQCQGYRIIQDPKRFCFGVDAVFLANYVKANKGARVLDLGTGTGIIPILLAAKTQADTIVGLEIQEESAQMAMRSVQLNHLEARVKIQQGDIKEAAAIFAAASFDVVTSNPPYIKEQGGLKNAFSPKTIARHEVCCTLADVICATSHTLKSGGSFYMIHKPHRVAEICEEMRKKHIEPKRMRFIHPYVDKEPILVLVEGRKDGGTELRVEPPLILYRESGVYTEEVEQLYKQGADLPQGSDPIGKKDCAQSNLPQGSDPIGKKTCEQGGKAL